MRFIYKSPRFLNSRSTPQSGARALARERQRRERRYEKHDGGRTWPSGDLSPLFRIASWAALRVPCPNTDVEERADSVFFRLVLDHKRISEAPNPTALAKKIAVNHLIDLWRREESVPQKRLSELRAMSDETVTDDQLIGSFPNHGHDGWWRSEVLQRCFDAMSAGLELLDWRERAILSGFYGLDGREPVTIGQLAGMLGRSEDRVKHLKSEALGKMRRFLNALGFRRISG
jgi:DNA-directed RNA polymerase specialized sigma24 family protein